MPASPPSEAPEAAFRVIADRLRADATLWADFEHLCQLGGRLAGGTGDRAAADCAARALEAMGATVARIDIPFDAWQATRAELRIDGHLASLPVRALLRSASTPPAGLPAEVIDLGRGSEADFAREHARLPGRIALVSHEYPFANGHLHRRRKYNWACEHGCAGFLIANPITGGGLLSGSSGRARGAPGIPAGYVSAEVAAQLRHVDARVRLHIEGVDREATAPNVIADFPGSHPEQVVLSAHLDGHDLAESALDNATGVAVALAVARAWAASRRPHALRVALFSAEEWALTGSAKVLSGLSADERGRMRVNINLDTVGGDETLTALVSESARMEALTHSASRLSGVAVATHWPLMENSDHANFHRAGIPALRLIAGFDRPASRVRHILSAQDTRDKVRPAELTQAAIVAAAMALVALT
jgi:aminopeptidase YwaD